MGKYKVFGNEIGRLMGMTPNYQPYESVRATILDGDCLLFRTQPTTISRLIGVGGRSLYSHAAMAVWYWPNDPTVRPILLCCEVREFKGGRAVTLSSQVKQFNHSIDVYRPMRGNTDAAAAYMMRKAGEAYNYGGLWQAAKLHLPLFALWQKPNLDDDSPSGASEFCSQAVSAAYRLGGGVDPVPNLADSETEPGDLGRSDLFRYLYTLTA